MTDIAFTHDSVSSPAPIEVLLIDDDQVTLESLSSLLRGDGYAVDAVLPAQADQVLTGQYRIAIAEIGALGMSDFSLLERIRSGGDNSIVIALAAYGMIEAAVEAVKRGAHAYVTKPVVEDDVRLTLQKELLQRQLIDENRSLKEALAMQGTWDRDSTPLGLGIGSAGAGCWTAGRGVGGIASLDEAMAGPEKQIILTTLRANNGNRQSTACQLGINRTTLYKKMKKHGLLTASGSGEG